MGVKKHTKETKLKISSKMKGTKLGGFNKFLKCKHCGKLMNVANFSRHEKACLYNISYSRLFSCPISTKEFKNFRKNLRISYNLSVEQYAKMFDSQNGQCAICKGSLKAQNKKSFCVDHCHINLINRGLLCNLCNLGLGYFKDDINILKSAIGYLNVKRK